MAGRQPAPTGRAGRRPADAVSAAPCACSSSTPARARSSFGCSAPTTRCSANASWRRRGRWSTRTRCAGARRDGLGDADAVGHRIVHGGERFRDAVRIDHGVVDELNALTDLAPLHQPKSLAALDAVSRALPELPARRVLRHRVPRDAPAGRRHVRAARGLAGALGPAPLRVSRALARVGRAARGRSWSGARRTLRIVSCHLGAGASLCAIVDGASIDTTMGFTPLEGLVMATRSGSVDPGHAAVAARA